MKKLIFVVILCAVLGGAAFGQVLGGALDVSLGFQYGLVNTWNNAGGVARSLLEPGFVLGVRFNPGMVGFFGRVGLLLPMELKEGDRTLTYDQYQYILFVNGALGATFKAIDTPRIALIIDAGVSINDLVYGFATTGTIDTSWKVTVENGMGQTLNLAGGEKFDNVKMDSTWNDVGVGLLANLAFRFKFNSLVYMELGGAVSFDFLRWKTYKFSATFPSTNLDKVKNAFPAAMVEQNASGTITATFDETNVFSMFRQFSFVPSLSVGFTF